MTPFSMILIWLSLGVVNGLWAVYYDLKALHSTTEEDCTLADAFIVGVLALFGPLGLMVRVYHALKGKS